MPLNRAGKGFGLAGAAERGMADGILLADWLGVGGPDPFASLALVAVHAGTNARTTATAMTACPGLMGNAAPASC